MTPTISIEQEIMFFDTDCGGVVHNIAYLRFIEIARTKLAGQMGMDLKSMASTQVFPVVVRTEIDYRKPAKLGDILQVNGVLAALKRGRFWCTFQVHRPSDDTLLIDCRQALALVKMPEGKPMRLPGDWKTRFTPSEENSS